MIKTDGQATDETESKNESWVLVVSTCLHYSTSSIKTSYVVVIGCLGSIAGIEIYNHGLP